jgi:hypothetical protein
MEHSEHEHGNASFSVFSSRANIVLLGFLAIAGYFLVIEHWAHVVPFLPWALVLACPLMHVFMHGGRGGRGGGSGDGGGPPTGGQSPSDHY